ncbi:CRISPR-associated DxTHG motif protein [Thermodesulfobacterium thermophilum]|uniref:CRISPR-associated DxTHG motif protein n=1 Tax=Thermodesulfobacterium thermophilum TaxID=886 RepID=UPI0003B64376|nr:TM1812 family CRISPR-associated protein [Thermodesulfobacterium thermophilum]
MEKSIFLYPLGDLSKYREITYIYNSEENKSKLPILWLCEKLENVEKIVFVITKKLQKDYYLLFENLCEFLLNKRIDEVFEKDIIKRFKRKENYEEHKSLFCETLKSKTNFTYDFLVIDEDNLVSFVANLKTFMEKHIDNIFHIDITHGYRFIPMFLTIVVSLLKNAGLPIKLGEILYAFGETSAKNRVISLKEYMGVMDWSHGIFTFKNSANIRPIAEFLQGLMNDISETLNTLQSSLDMNLSPKIKETLKELKIKINDCKFENDVYSLVLEEIRKMLGEFKSNGSQSEFEFSLAKWHLENKRYLHGYVALIESLVTKLCEAYKLNSSKREDREIAKAILIPIKENHQNEEYKQFIDKYIKGNAALYDIQKPLSILFNELSNIRNCFAHIKDLSEDEANKIYKNSIKLAEHLTPSTLSKKIKWEKFEAIFEDIERLPNLLVVEKLRELSNIYKNLSKEQGNV